ncbi:phosphoenolpyruvate synthase [Candidatus Bathyarchaeota archaeon]|nr:phosphoenolpyruvate synthase [Candidatus Bathyarchaeota archaeon]
MSSKRIAWFKEISKNDIRLVGGKAANLGEMHEKFPIPDGFVLTANIYFEIIEQENLKNEIKELLEDLDVEDTGTLQSTSGKIKQLFMNLSIGNEMREGLMDAFDELSGGNDDFITSIRSSATAEDLPEASFAGQLETYLAVPRERYVETVKKCWASLFTPRAIYYREKNGFNHLDIALAVIVQEYMPSDVAGVMFTADPATGEDVIVIEAAFGIGETVVSGTVTPDTYRVDPGTWAITSKKVATQAMKVVREGASTREVDVDEEDGREQKLPDNVIKELARIGKNIEKHYGETQDIEWVFADGLGIVQSRPITTGQESSGGDVDENGGNPPNASKYGKRKILSGLAASPGVGFGSTRIVTDASGLDAFKKKEVLVTGMTTPDMVPGMKRASAIITDEGGTTSHAAIVSRELGIPCVVGTGKATTLINEGQEVTVDGNQGFVYEGRIENLLESEAERIDSEKVARSTIITGTKLFVNLSSPGTAESVAARNVDGVGLLRAEFIAADIGKHPKSMIAHGRGKEWQEQLASGIKVVAKAFYPRDVVYRTLDFKTNEYKELEGGSDEPDEANPMLGYRGCYRNITSKEVFYLELGAVKQVREEYGLTNLHVMIPYVRRVDNLARAIEMCKAQGLERGKNFKIWVMVEVPSTVFLINRFIKLVDGISIGSNDLTQLILGVDRDNENLSNLFDERDPAVLRAMGMVIEACKNEGITASICGQAPSMHDDIVDFLVRKGITSISVNPDAIERTRRLIAKVERKILLDAARR